MPRIRRIIFPSAPHHIIQRGNRNQNVFFTDDDKQLYLEILSHKSRLERVKIWCYCLMDNHVHIIAVPEDATGLRRAISETHKKYTLLINIRNNWKGHLWQGRFISYPMDETYLYRCMRYIELNPVRAGLVNRAEDYKWSSARAHVLNIDDGLLSPIPLAYRVEDWKNYLRETECENDLKTFRRSNGSGAPLGSDTFIKRLEAELGIILTRRNQIGRKEEDTGDPQSGFLP